MWQKFAVRSSARTGRAEELARGFQEALRMPKGAALIRRWQYAKTLNQAAMWTPRRAEWVIGDFVRLRRRIREGEPSTTPWPLHIFYQLMHHFGKDPLHSYV